MAKNTHLEHLEDDILNQGKQGGFNAIAFLRELGKMLSQPQSGIRVTTKWDGAPAIICGTNPITGNFFVGTKSVFAKDAKIIESPEAADRYYSGQLAQKLKDSYRYLSTLGISGVVQGDLLFTDDKREGNINGEQCYIFQPNTIVYAVPKNSDMGRKVARAKLGIVFHTTYTGSSFDNMSASFGANVAGNDDVITFSANFQDASGVARLTPAENGEFTRLVNRAEGSLRQASSFLTLLGQTGTSKFMMNVLFKQFFNSYIRQGRAIRDANAVTNDFAMYYASLLDKEIASKKTKAAQDKYKKMKEDGLKFLNANKRSVYFTVASYMNLIEAKNFIIRKLERVQTLGTFLRTENGYKVTAPEGFVAIRSGNALKLVDRLEFSRANFTADKNWDKA